MTAKIKLNAASGGGSFSLQAPSSSSNNRVFTLPDSADATLLTSTASLGKTLKIQQSLISSISDFSAADTTYQTISEPTFVVAGTNTNLLIQLTIMGGNNATHVDRNFRLAYKVGSGSYTNINFNSNGSISENMFSNIRGETATQEVRINTSFLIDGTWSAGSTITGRLETIGEGTFHFNGAIAASAVRFGNGLSKIIFTEYSD